MTDLEIQDLYKMTEWLEANPDVDIHISGYKYYTANGKDAFLATVKAFGSCEKDLSHDREIRVKKRFGSIAINLEIPRYVICEKVTVVKEVEEWQCPSLLSDAEIAVLGAE